MSETFWSDRIWISKLILKDSVRNIYLIGSIATWSILSFSRSSTICAPSSQLERTDCECVANKKILILKQFSLFLFTWKLHRRQCHTLRRTSQSPSRKSCIWTSSRVKDWWKIASERKSFKFPLFEVLSNLIVGDHPVSVCQFQSVLNVDDFASLPYLWTVQFVITSWSNTSWIIRNKVRYLLSDG